MYANATQHNLPSRQTVWESFECFSTNLPIVSKMKMSSLFKCTIANYDATIYSLWRTEKSHLLNLSHDKMAFDEIKSNSNWTTWTSQLAEFHSLRVNRGKLQIKWHRPFKNRTVKTKSCLCMTMPPESPPHHFAAMGIWEEALVFGPPITPWRSTLLRNLCSILQQMVVRVRGSSKRSMRSGGSGRLWEAIVRSWKEKKISQVQWKLWTVHFTQKHVSFILGRKHTITMGRFDEKCWIILWHLMTWRWCFVPFACTSC